MIKTVPSGHRQRQCIFAILKALSGTLLHIAPAAHHPPRSGSRVSDPQQSWVCWRKHGLSQRPKGRNLEELSQVTSAATQSLHLGGAFALIVHFHYCNSLLSAESSSHDQNHTNKTLGLLFLSCSKNETLCGFTNRVILTL